MFRCIKRLWSWAFGPRTEQKQRRFVTVSVEDLLPASLEAFTLYVVSDDGFLEQVAMLCPCGCKRLLHMNLLHDERPCWTLTLHQDGTASLFPSVWRKKDCGSHFWLKRGIVQWC